MLVLGKRGRRFESLLRPCASHFILYSVLVQPRKLPDMSEKLSTGMLSLNSENRGTQLLSESVLDLGLKDCQTTQQSLKQATLSGLELGLPRK